MNREKASRAALGHFQRRGNLRATAHCLARVGCGIDLRNVRSAERLIKPKTSSMTFAPLVEAFNCPEATRKFPPVGQVFPKDEPVQLAGSFPYYR